MVRGKFKQKTVLYYHRNGSFTNRSKWGRPKNVSLWIGFVVERNVKRVINRCIDSDVAMLYPYYYRQLNLNQLWFYIWTFDIKQQ